MKACKDCIWCNVVDKHFKVCSHPFVSTENGNIDYYYGTAQKTLVDIQIARTTTGLCESKAKYFQSK